MLPLRVLPEHHDEIIAHCRRCYPKEACGLLAGSADRVAPEDQWRFVLQVYPMTNVEDSPIGYALDPKEQLLVEKRMRSRRQKMLGIYHSHTATDAVPSAVDISLAVSPDISYVLVSLKDPTRPVFTSYRIDGPKVVKEDVLLGVRPHG